MPTSLSVCCVDSNFIPGFAGRAIAAEINLLKAIRLTKSRHELVSSTPLFLSWLIHLYLGGVPGVDSGFIHGLAFHLRDEETAPHPGDDDHCKHHQDEEEVQSAEMVQTVIPSARYGETWYGNLEETLDDGVHLIASRFSVPVMLVTCGNDARTC